MVGFPNPLNELLIAQHTSILRRSVRKQPFVFGIRSAVKAFVVSMLLQLTSSSTVGHDVKNDVCGEAFAPRSSAVRRVVLHEYSSVAGLQWSKPRNPMDEVS